jgi:hypothetical protein
MRSQFLPPKFSRRTVLQLTAAGAPGFLAAKSGWAQVRPDSKSTVRDRLWVFACPANSDWSYFKRRSVMSPAESAFYFGVPNIIMVQIGKSTDQFKRFEPPFEQYAIALRPLKRVQWSVAGSGGFTSNEETRQVLELARKTPNITGLYLDDFFYEREREGKRAALSLDEVKTIRRELTGSGKTLDLNVTFYTNQLDLPVADYLDLMDQVTLWTWKPSDLKNLETNLTKLEKLAPRAHRMLGCYVVDYDGKKSTPVPEMKFQCETGLRWLRQKRIDGIVFLGNTSMDLGFEAVEWTRDWIATVGDTAF